VDGENCDDYRNGFCGESSHCFFLLLSLRFFFFFFFFFFFLFVFTKRKNLDIT